MESLLDCMYQNLSKVDVRLLKKLKLSKLSSNLMVLMFLPFFSIPANAAAPGTIWNSFLGYFDTADAFCRALSVTNLGGPYSTFTYQYADSAGNCYWTRDINGTISSIFSSNYSFPEYYCLAVDASKTVISLDPSKPFDRQCPEPLPRVPVCPVADLQPITDPEAELYEDGPYRSKPDLDHITSATASGAACIRQLVGQTSTGSAHISSGYRPQTYQDHIREVWDKWQILENNETPECSSVKESVAKEWDRHRLTYQPGIESNHKNGTAVDIVGVPPLSADFFAGLCNMFRPYAKDKVHYQPR